MIEREAGSDASFEYLAWDRTDHDGSPGGGGVRGVMKGRIFAKSRRQCIDRGGCL